MTWRDTQRKRENKTKKSREERKQVHILPEKLGENMRQDASLTHYKIRCSGLEEAITSSMCLTIFVCLCFVIAAVVWGGGVCVFLLSVLKS